MTDERLYLTADEAIGLLPDDVTYIHNTTAGAIMIGIDYTREGAEEALRKAHQIEIGGPGAKAYRHPIVMWDTPTHFTLFEADMAKVDAFEAKRAAEVA